MAKYYFTKKAVSDLTNIWDYTYEEWSEHQADKYYQTLIDTGLISSLRNENF